MEGNRDFVEFVEKLRANNREAWEKLCRDYVPIVARVAASRLRGWGGRSEPEAVALSVVATFWRHMNQGEFDFANAGGLKALLCRIAVRKAGRRLQKLSRALPDISGGKGGFAVAAEVEAEANEFFARVDALLEPLSDTERVVFRELLQGEMTQKQIADNVGRTARWVRNCLYKIRALLRELKEDEP